MMLSKLPLIKFSKVKKMNFFMTMKYSSNTKQSTVFKSSDTDCKMRSFDSIPSVYHSIPFFSSIIKFALNGGAGNLHTHCDHHFRRLGPIYRERLGTVDAVFISDGEMMKQVFSQEDSAPGHFLPEPWLLYNQSFQVQRGLLFLEGQEWKQARLALNPLFLGKKSLQPCLNLLNEIACDFARNWLEQMNEKAWLDVEGLESSLNSYMIEVMGAFLFGNRMGCVKINQLKKEKLVQIDDEEHQIHLRFQRAVKDIFVETGKMQFLPAKLAQKLNIPVWKRFVNATSNAFQLAGEMVQQQQHVNTCTHTKGAIVKMAKDERIQAEQLTSIVVDLFLASTDTTSQTLQWALVMLAKHPQYQQQMFEESISVNNLEMSEQTLNQLKFTRSVMKETLRLYPISPFISRVYSKDIQVGGYQIPKGQMIVMSLYTAGRMDQHYLNPDKFLPQRWMRDEEKARNQSFAFIPFAAGARSCIGRKLAEAEVILLLSSLMKHFTIELLNQDNIDIRLQMITAPNQEIKIRLHPRLAC